MSALFSIPVAAVLLIAAPAIAEAQSFTIQNGQTATTTQTMAGPSDVGIVEQGGAISTTVNSQSAIVSSGVNATITNYGTISTTGFAARAVRVTGAGARVTNFGTVSTLKGFGEAFVLDGANSVIDNFGLITTAMQYGNGITSRGDDTRIANYGQISTAGLFASAIYSAGDRAFIVNDGLLSATSSNANIVLVEGTDTVFVNNGDIKGVSTFLRAVAASGDRFKFINNGSVAVTGTYYGVLMAANDGEIWNSGSIRTTGNDTVGVLLDFNTFNSRVDNSGTIAASGQNAIALQSYGNGDIITNSGTISAQGSGSLALDFQGANSTLNLLQGSSIEGLIGYAPGAASSGTLNVANGLSTVLSFSGAVPANVNTNGMITSVDRPGLRVVTADASAVQASGVGLSAMIDGVFNSLQQNRSGSSRSAPLEPAAYFARPAEPEAFAFLDETQSVVRPRAWLNAFGGLSTASLNAGTQASSRLGGLAIGIDVPLGQSDTVGIFGGAAKGQTLAGSTDVGEESGFAGLYGSHQFDDYALDMALVFGATRYTSTRSILDSTVPGGVATASADYNGFFVSPEIGLGRQFDVDGQAIAVRGALQYAGLFVDGYTESGSVGALSLDQRSAQQVTAKASIALPLLVHSDADITTRLTPRLGVDVTTQFGGQIVTGTLAGTPISFAGNSGPSLKLSAGAQLEHQVSDRWSLIADLEGSVSSGNVSAGQASLALNVKF